MKLGDITRPMIQLLEDALAAEEFLDANDNQFARRSYIRSMFVTFEGIVWLLKQVCLKARSKSGVRKFDPAEYALLQDQTYELKKNGDTVVQTKFLRFPENFRFTVRIINRLFNAQVDLGIGTTSWDNFLRAVAIRHRITHPKSVDELYISDEEIQLSKNVSSWFNDTIHASVQAIAQISDKPAK